MAKAVKVTRDMIEADLAAINWDRIRAMTDEDIARQIAENPDAAPDYAEPRARLVMRLKSKRRTAKYKVTLVRRALRLTRAEFSSAYGIPLRTLEKWEQGVRVPDQATLSYLVAIAAFPDKIGAALHASAAPYRSLHRRKRVRTAQPRRTQQKKRA